MQRLLTMLGGGALLLATGTELAAVLGRYIGVPLLGSIELVQAAVLVSASTSIVLATIAGRHAMVHLLLDRVGPRARTWLQRVNYGGAVLFFGALAAGSIWIASELWSGQEETELLRIGYRPLRMLAIGAVLFTALLFLRLAFRERRR
jgi:TRAP-type C4-dicarboxylate transport system permease small subunit